MKTSIQNNYQNIRNMIKSNVDTIILLVEQAQGLEKIVADIADNEANNDLKNKLENQIADLRKTIADLVKQTESLFESYDEMVQSAFN